MSIDSIFQMNFRIACGAIAVLSVSVLLLSGCRSQNNSQTQALRSTQQSTAVILDQARQDGAPDGVDPLIYTMLLDELERVLEKSQLSRVVSAPPSGTESQIKDLTYTDNDLESFSLSWSYTNAGDYDNNSEVNLGDVTTIGQNFGKKTGDPDWDAVASMADGDGNGEVNVADVTVIGRHFGKNLGGYNLYCSADAVSDPELIGTMSFAEIANPTELIVFVTPYVVDAPGDFQNSNEAIYSVIPFDGAGTEPADPTTAATVKGDKIVLYNSSFIDDYKGLRWSQADNGARPDPILDWIYARFTKLTPDVQPPPPADQLTHQFVGRAEPQTMDARFNLSKGTGRINMVSEDGLLSIKMRGAAGAFVIDLTADVIEDTPFSPNSLSATPYVIVSSDGALVSVEEYKVDGTDYADQMIGSNTNLAVFFPDDPLLINAAGGGLPDWAEKWCMIQDATGSIPDLQEY